MLYLYQDLKLAVVQLTGLSKDAIHIYVGLLIFFITVSVFRKGHVDIPALIPVAVLAISMEAIDLAGDFVTMDRLYWGNSLHDLVNTCFWPGIIVLLARFDLMGKQTKTG